jgi:hypothetical protein
VNIAYEHNIQQGQKLKYLYGPLEEYFPTAAPPLISLARFTKYYWPGASAAPMPISRC